MAKQKGKTKADLEHQALSMREKIYSYWAELLVLNIIAVFPLYLHKQKYIQLTGHKANYLWFSSLAMFVILALIAMTFAGLIKSKGFSLKKFGLADWAVIAYWLSVVLSAIFTPIPNYNYGESNFSFFMRGYPERQDGILTITIYVMLYFAVSRIYKSRERDWAIFAVSASVVSLIGIFQFIGWDIFELYPYGYEAPGVVGFYPFNYLDTIFRTTLGNTNIVSPFVCLVIGFFTALYMRSDKKIRFLYLATVGLTFGLMITAGADGGKLGVLSGIMLLLILNITDKRAISRLFFAVSLGCLVSVIYPPALAARAHFNQTGVMQSLYWVDWYKNIWLIGAVLSLAVGLAIHFLPVWLKAKKRFAALITAAAIVIVAFAGIMIMGPRFSDDYENIVWQAYETLRGNFDDMFGSGRAVTWKVTAEVMFDYPLLGTGPDTFDYAVRDYQGYLHSVTNTVFDKAHNEFLQIMICHGIIGLAAFLLFLGSLAVTTLRKVWDENPLIMAVIAASGAYLVQAFFGVNTPIVTPLFFVMCGLAENFRMGRHKFQYNEKDV